MTGYNNETDALTDTNSAELASPVARIIGGSDARHIPWIVKIFYWGRNAQGVSTGTVESSTGFLVSSMWILTARHAVERPLRTVAPEDITVIAFYLVSGDPGAPLIRRVLHVDSIAYAPTVGDIIALRLHEPVMLDEYAPVSLEQTAAELLARRQSVSVFAYGTPRNFRLGTAFGTVSSVENNPFFHGSEVVFFPFDLLNGSGGTEGGDSGGPVMQRFPDVIGSDFGLVVGIQVMGTGRRAAFVLLADHRDFIEPLLMPHLTGSLSESAFLLRSSLHMLSNCSDFQERRLAKNRVAEGTGNAATDVTSCTAFESYQFFFKKTSDGDSWDSASAYNVKASAHDQVFELPLDPAQPHSYSELWDITALPVGPGGRDSKVIGAGENGKPLPGAQSNFYIRQTPTVSLPAMMQADKEIAMPGMVRVTWSNSDCPISGVIRGYTLFYMPADQIPVSWEGCERMSVPATSYKSTAVVIPVDTSKTYALLALPVVGDEVAGTNESGLPYSGAFRAGEVLLIGAPVVRYQTPGDGRVLHVESSSHGTGIIADVSFDDQNTYTWMRLGDLWGPEYTSEGDWSHISGKDSPVLVFGTPENPARAEDDGWYKLKVENAFGTVETRHVFVQIK